MTHHKLLLTLSVPALLLVSACSSEPAAEDDGEVVLDSTVATLLQGEDELSTTAGLMVDTGLAPVLDAAPSYTLLAPTDAAFAAIEPADEAGTDGPDRKAVMAAIMRAHLLPGYVTRADVEASIDAANGDAVTMQTMADTTITFTREGEALKVTAADGATATLAGAGVSGGNGVILPIDAVLKTL
jgi:uncharacterized surface protein with fasciclin (FAS1) repeats